MQNLLRSPRTTMQQFAIVMAAIFYGATIGLSEESPATLQLTLPSEFHAVVGQEINVYFDNIVLTETPEVYRFTVTSDVGKTSKRRWAVVPKPEDVGAHQLEISVADSEGRNVGRATTTLHVVAASAGETSRDADAAVRLLIVGDSLTHATQYPNELARLLSQPGNPKWKMLGTHKPRSAGKGVTHEGYGGWTWQRFVSQYEPKPDGTHRKRSSPFVFVDAAGKPELNVERYFDEKCGGERPDYVLFLLGINDCFSADPDDLAAIDARIDSMLKSAERLLAEFRKAAPYAELGVCLTTPPNARESGFEANYKGAYHRWGWKRIQHRLVQRQLKHFSHRTDDNIFLVSTALNLDPVDGYPANNGVHPNAFGYKQIGTSLFVWLKSRLAAGG